MREIKELYFEELALLKQIRSYGKEHSQGELERVEKVKLLLLYRIYSNLYSSLLLTVQILSTGKVSFFQLPIGLMLPGLRRVGFEKNRVCQFDVGAQRGIQRSGEKYRNDT